MTHARIITLFIGLLASIVVNIEPAIAAKYICEVSTKFVCGSDTGCQKNPTGVWNEIDTEQRTRSPPPNPCLTHCNPTLFWRF
jgi:hypothetical protein